MREETAVRQTSEVNKFKIYAEAIVAFAIVIGAFLLDWNISDLKESETKGSQQAQLAEKEATGAVLTAAPAMEVSKDVEEAKSDEVTETEVVVAETEETKEIEVVAAEIANQVKAKKQFLGGCRNAHDFVNINLLLENVESFENFTTIINEIRFVDGQVQFPTMAENGALLKSLKTFFEKVDVLNEEELNSCINILERAKQFNMARLSYDTTKAITANRKAG